MTTHVLDFADITLRDVARVGGKNASLGELFRALKPRGVGEASFAGAAGTFLNVRGREALLRAVHACWSSLFTDRAISYRARLGYDQLKVALSVGIMPMVRSDKASAGVIFTLDTESGFRDVVAISGSYGLGESVVKGTVIPDEWAVFTPWLVERVVSPLRYAPCVQNGPVPCRHFRVVWCVEYRR